MVTIGNIINFDKDYFDKGYFNMDYFNKGFNMDFDNQKILAMVKNLIIKIPIIINILKNQVNYLYLVYIGYFSNLKNLSEYYFIYSFIKILLNNEIII